MMQARGLGLSHRHCIQHRCDRLRSAHVITATAASTPDSAPPPGGAAWWDKLNRVEGIKGPNWKPREQRPMQPIEEQKKAQMGERGYRSWENIKKTERQRVWDAMRLNARIRHERGEMPEWFDPDWLNIQEAPMNTYWRELGMEPYQADDKQLQYIGGLGGQGGAGGSNGGGGGGGPWWDSWWNEEDPYWPLRDWGDHPMRWWTLLFAAVMAVGGVQAFLRTGSSESLMVGSACATSLTVCSMAMSDMTYGWTGHVAVKVAWGVCAAVALKELLLGWRHQWTAVPQEPRLRACGWAAILMCTFYMWTGMSGMEQALPMNPGGAWKMSDVAMKHRAWEKWGYGDVQMR